MVAHTIAALHDNELGNLDLTLRLRLAVDDLVGAPVLKAHQAGKYAVGFKQLVYTGDDAEAYNRRTITVT